MQLIITKLIITKEKKMIFMSEKNEKKTIFLQIQAKIQLLLIQKNILKILLNLNKLSKQQILIFLVKII